MLQEDWYPKPSHPALAPYHIEVPDSELKGICRGYPGLNVYGCAVRAFALKVCFIYTGQNPAPWLMKHERKHCAGWDHGGTPQPNLSAVGREVGSAGR